MKNDSLRASLLAFGALVAAADPAAAQSPDSPVVIEWTALTGDGVGDPSTDLTLPSSTEFVRLSALGNNSHGNTWIRFVAHATIASEFFDTQGLPQVLLDNEAEFARTDSFQHLSNYPPQTAGCVLQDADMAAILVRIWDPALPEMENSQLVKQTFEPIFSTGGGNSACAWDTDYPHLSALTKLGWDSVTAPQDGTVISPMSWMKQLIYEQSGGEIDPEWLFNSDWVGALVAAGIDLRIQAIMVWDDTGTTNGTAGNPSGLVGQIQGIATSTPIEYSIKFAQSNGGGGGKPYPAGLTGFYPITLRDVLEEGERFDFQMIGFIRPTYAALCINGDASNVVIVSAQAGPGLDEAYLTVPSGLSSGDSCEIMGFVARGKPGRRIPAAHRDGFDIP